MKYLHYFLLITILISCNNSESANRRKQNNQTSEITSLTPKEYINKEESEAIGNEKTESSFCNYSTSNSKKVESLNIQVSYPCNWTEYESHDPNEIIKFGDIANEEQFINAVLAIDEIGSNLTPSIINNILMPKKLKSFINPGNDKFISARNVSICDKKAGEIIYERSIKEFSEYSFTTVNYIFFHETYMIQIQYTTGAVGRDNANKLFMKNKDLFYKLVTSTITSNSNSSSQSTQSSPSDLYQSLCSYITTGKGKSQGIKLKLVYPCEWKQKEGDRPHVVQKFTTNLGNGKTISENIVITKIPVEPTSNEISLFFDEESLKEYISEKNTYISSRIVKIDGIKCAELISKTSRESPISTIHAYNITYLFFHENKLISINYIMGGIRESDAEQTYLKYKKLFQSLVSQTVVISKWE